MKSPENPSIRVLLADDHPIVMTGFAMSLESEGMNVTEIYRSPPGQGEASTMSIDQDILAGQQVNGAVGGVSREEHPAPAVNGDRLVVEDAVGRHRQSHVVGDDQIAQRSGAAGVEGNGVGSHPSCGSPYHECGRPAQQRVGEVDKCRFHGFLGRLGKIRVQSGCRREALL